MRLFYFFGIETINNLTKYLFLWYSESLWEHEQPGMVINLLLSFSKRDFTNMTSLLILIKRVNVKLLRDAVKEHSETK